MFTADLSDWRSARGYGRGGAYDYDLYGTGDVPTPRDPTRYVLRWMCQYCETHYLGAVPAPQPCPECQRPLAQLQVWDLRTERAPHWWRGTGGLP